MLGPARKSGRIVRGVPTLGDARKNRANRCLDKLRAGRMSTVAEQRRENKHVREGVGEEAFVRRREARDQELDLPRLILPSLQVNIRGGALPDPESNGVSYLKIPLNAL